ncbi:MAG: hypothetical protein R2731_09720 [Nocardioides sp.]
MHGPGGVVDLVVPSTALPTDLAAEYARQAGGSTRPALTTVLGQPLAPDAPLDRLGIESGAVVVAVDSVPRPVGPRAALAGLPGRPSAIPGAWPCSGSR